jgi:diacylglycerol kinase (ATP)
VPLFLAGIWLAWLVLPNAVHFLLGFTPAGTQNIITAGEYFTFVLQILITFGIAFVTPLLLVALNMVGVVSAATLAKGWRLAVFLCFLFAAIASPTADAGTMLALAFPMVGLYMLAVGIAWLTDRRRARRAAQSELAGLGDDEASPLPTADPFDPQAADPFDPPGRGRRRAPGRRDRGRRDRGRGCRGGRPAAPAVTVTSSTGSPSGPVAGAITLAVNPRSGGGRGRKVGAAVRAALAAAGVAVREVHASDPSHAAAVMVDAVRAGTDALVVVGGDGMVHLAVNAVAGTATPLGIVPAGTGNDIARELGLPADVGPAVAAVAAALAEGGLRHVDAVRCVYDAGTRWFGGVLAAGFDAIVNERANGWADGWGWPRGSARYSLAVARELPSFRQRDYLLELDGVRVETSALIVAVANLPAYGGGMRIAPNARADDGLLDVVVAGPIGRVEFARVFPRVFSGEHVDHPRVHVHRAARVRVAAQEGLVAYADGERVGPLPLECEAVPGALCLLAVGGNG